MHDDTHPEVARRMIDLLRAAGPHGRFQMMERLTATTRALSRRAICRRHPEWTDREVDVEFVAVMYGRELAERLRAFFASRAT